MDHLYICGSLNTATNLSKKTILLKINRFANQKLLVPSIPECSVLIKLSNYYFLCLQSKYLYNFIYTCKESLYCHLNVFNFIATSIVTRFFNTKGKNFATVSHKVSSVQIFNQNLFLFKQIYKTMSTENRKRWQEVAQCHKMWNSTCHMYNSCIFRFSF